LEEIWFLYQAARLYVLLESNYLALGHIDSLDHLVVVELVKPSLEYFPYVWSCEID
jgi:hypothetical protein